MTELISNPTKCSTVAVKMDFVVNEFSRIKVPPQRITEPQNFREMSTMQRQMIVKRLIEHVNEL